jgi:hypothetical protein
MAYNYNQHLLPPDKYVLPANKTVLNLEDYTIKHIIATINIEVT